VLYGRSPLCGPPQTVSSLSCVPFSVRSLLMVNTLPCEHTCHIYRISNTSQFSYQRLTRIVLVTTDPIIAVSLGCLSDGIFPARKPGLHHLLATDLVRQFGPNFHLYVQQSLDFSFQPFKTLYLEWQWNYQESSG